MPLAFHPSPGAIVICRYGTGSGYQPPEMCKTRPAVVISPRRRSGQIVTVVPLSETRPAPLDPWHHELSRVAYPPARGPMWAKCDLVAAVSFARLDRVRFGGQFHTYQMPPADLAAILAGVRAALGF
jgi:uncharacterized protein YifN (PemK superfamily)